MRHSLLVSFISTLAFSFGLVGAGPTLIEKKGLQAPIFDAMGIASNHIVCRKHTIGKPDTAYNKREAYAAVAQAMTYLQMGNHAVVGCQSLKICSKYPKKFNDHTIKFKTKGPHFAFPLLANGQIFKGDRLFPVSDLVIFTSDGEVAGIVHAGLRGYTKCLIDDNFVQRPKAIADKLKYTYQYYKGEPLRTSN